MGAEEQNRNEFFSRIIAELSVQSPGGEDLQSKIRRLREELKNAVGHEGTVFGKIRGLVESFREIIPDEKQRYHAAIKALSATSKLSVQEIVKAVNTQAEELKILEKGLVAALPGWREELKAMETRSRQIRDEITQLRDIIGRLENEEKGIISAMASRQKEMGQIEKSVGEIFSDIGAEIAALKKKVEECTTESAAPAPQPVAPPPRPAPVPAEIFPGEPGGGAQASENLVSPPAAQDAGAQKKCPMCGGRMDFNINEKIWMCYSCAYEEAGKDEVPVKNGEKSEVAAPPVAQQDTEWQRRCPMCGGRMNFHANEQVWLCYTCAHEEGRGEARSEKLIEFESSSPSDEESGSDEPIRGSLPSKGQQPAKKKTCPSCRKKMNFYEDERIWRCPYCEYERRI